MTKASHREGPKRADVFVDLRHHRRPREGDDVSLALPVGAARAARLPDRRGRGGRLDGGAAGRAGARVDRRHRRGARPGGVRPLRRAALLRPGDFGDAATYARVGDAIKGAETPVFYLEIPPFLFGRVVQGLADAGLTECAGRRGEALRPRPRVGARARGRAPSVRRRVPALPDRPLPREDGDGGDPVSPVRELAARADLEPELRRVRPDHDGGGLRRRGSRTLLRPRRGPAGRRREPSDAGRRGGGDGAAGRRRPEDAQGLARLGLSARFQTADPAHYVRGQYDGYLDIEGVAPDSTTETYAALRLDIENWRWAGVPFFIRTGKRLPVTQTELRLVFKHPPRLRSSRSRGCPRRTSSSSSSIRHGHQADRRRAQGRRGRAGPRRARPRVRRAGRRRPDAVRGAPARGARRQPDALHAPGRRRGGVAGVPAAAGFPAAGARLRARLVGPRGGRGLVAGHGSWHGPWIAE